MTDDDEMVTMKIGDREYQSEVRRNTRIPAQTLQAKITTKIVGKAKDMHYATDDTTEQYHEAERALFSLLHVNPNRVGHLSTDSIYEAARNYVAAVDAIRETVAK